MYICTYKYNVKDYKLSAPVAVVTIATTTQQNTACFTTHTYEYVHMYVCMDNIGTYMHVHEY